MNVRISTLFLLLSFASSCVKDKPQPSDSGYTYESGRKVYFVNEGNYGSGNATLGVYNIASGNVYNDIYEFVNKKPLGDVLQSMCNIDGKLFLAVNHSDKIVVCNPNTLYEEGVIDLYSPRYFLPIHISKVYVSSLYSNSIFVLNTLNLQIEKEIVMPSKSVEEMILLNGFVYASSWDENTNVIYKIDPTTDAIVQEIPFGGYASQSLLVDKNNHIWIKYGNVQKGRSYGFSVYNPIADKIEKSFHYASAMNEIIKPTMNANKDSIYWINVDYTADASTETGLFRMNINAENLPTQSFYKAARFQYFFALGIDTISNHIYLGDPKGFTESSEVIILDAAGNEIKRIQTGMGIGDFYFDNY